MNRAAAAALADRKALLAARAELDRARVRLAVHEIQAIVAPPPDAARTGALRPTASLLIGLGAPLLGPGRLGRWLRIASWALAAWRVARNWRAVR